MPLHPQAQEVLDRVEPWSGSSDLTVEEARARSKRDAARLSGPAPAVARVDDIAISGPSGEIPLRLYVPYKKSSTTALVWFHGGGFVLGSIAEADPLVRALARATGCPTFSVGYRLAPEHPFPAAPDDCYAAVRWVARSTRGLGLDVDALAIGGDSAGGNLAAGVAITARDRGRPQIDCQVLVYPMTCRNLDANSRRRYSAGYLVSQDALEWCWRHYLPTGEDGSHPLVSPLLAASLVDLPPAVLVTAEFDVLRDEGEQYGCRLIEAGVAVRFRRYAGMLHGFLAHRGMVDAASLCLADLGRAVRNESSRRRDCARLVARAPRRRQDRPQEDAVRGALLAGNPEGERQPVFTTRGSSTTPPVERPGARPTGRAAH